MVRTTVGGRHVVTTSAVGKLQLGDHVCAFVDGLDDGLDLMARTVAAGLDAGDRVMVFTAALPPVAVLAGLEARGVAIPPAGRGGQVQVLSAQEAYLPAGRFEPRRTLESQAGHIEQARADGYAGLRLVGDMAWARGEQAGVEQLTAYEAQVNQLYLDGRAMGVCLYDRSAFGSDLLRQVAYAHPAMTGAGADRVPLLRIRRTTEPYGLRLAGEADFSNRLALASALDAVAEQQPEPAETILVNVADLRFLDAGTAALLGRLALRAPAGVHISAPQRAVERVLDHLGVLQLPKTRLTRAGDIDSPGTEKVA